MKIKLIEELKNLNEEKTILQEKLDNFKYVATEEEFDDSLDIEGPTFVLGEEFYPSHIIKRCDPELYQTLKEKFENDTDIEEIKEWNDLDKRMFDIRNRIEEIESKLED